MLRRAHLAGSCTLARSLWQFLVSRMSMPCCLVGSGFFLAGFGRDHEEAAAAHAALGSDPVGKMLCLGSGPSQGGNLHVVVVVEVDVKRRYREIMMAVIVLHQAS